MGASINATAAALTALQQQALASAENAVVPQSAQATLASLKVSVDVCVSLPVRMGAISPTGTFRPFYIHTCPHTSFLHPHLSSRTAPQATLTMSVYGQLLVVAIALAVLTITHQVWMIGKWHAWKRQMDYLTHFSSCYH